MASSSTLAILQPTMFCSRLFCLMPYSLSSRCLSVPALLYSFLLSVPIALGCHQLLKHTFTFYETSSTITFLVALQQVCSILLTLSSWLLVLWNYKDRFEAVESFLVLEKWTETVNAPINVNDLIAFQYFEISVVFFAVLVHFIVLILREGLSIVLFYCFSIASNITVLIEFLNCLLLTRIHLKTLNVKIVELSENGRAGVKVFERRFVHSPRTTSRLQNLRVLCEMHRYLFNHCIYVNGMYGVQLVLCISHNIASVIVILYVFLLSILSSDSTADEFFDGKLMLSFRLVKSAAELWVIVSVCSSVCDEANYTSVLVHGLLNEADLIEIKEELQLFSHQLLHQKISFSACGFFTLDFTLINGVIASVATYLVILIQFQMSS